MFNGRRIVALAATTALLGGGVAALAPSSAEAATKTGTATVKEGRKVVRQADSQKCLTRKEVRKYVHGYGNAGEAGTWWWHGKGKAEYLVVTFTGSCADGAYLYYDNGDAYAWIDGRVLWA